MFHFAEFSRIVPSFDNYDTCIKTNTYGTFEVIKFCLEKNSLKKIIKKLNLNVTDKKQKVGSIVKPSIEDFKRDLNEEKKSLQEEIYE